MAKSVLIGIVVAVAILAAFYFGFMFEEQQQGPIANLGEQIDKSVK